jgi:hypothetical protein
MSDNVSDDVSDKERLDHVINQAAAERAAYLDNILKGGGATQEELEQLQQMQDYESSLLEERYGIDFGEE